MFSSVAQLNSSLQPAPCTFLDNRKGKTVQNVPYQVHCVYFNLTPLFPLQCSQALRSSSGRNERYRPWERLFVFVFPLFPYLQSHVSRPSCHIRFLRVPR